METDREIELFWGEAQRQARLETVPAYFGPTALSSVPPPAWSFGDGAEADALLAAILDGTKTAMASARDSYDSDDDLPEIGRMSILLDGGGHPRALLVTTAVSVTAFGEVSEEHALTEGEESLAAWRESHERYFTDHDPTGRGVGPDLPVVLERFEVLHPASRSRATLRGILGG